MKCSVCGKEIKAGKPVCRECLDAFSPTGEKTAGWISVKDRLPEGAIGDGDYVWSEWVLVSTKNGVGVCQYCVKDEDGGSGWCDALVAGNCIRLQGEITHWMPLPEPPKEERSE